jgi:hypothetical protein
LSAACHNPPEPAQHQDISEEAAPSTDIAALTTEQDEVEEEEEVSFKEQVIQQPKCSNAFEVLKQAASAGPQLPPPPSRPKQKKVKKLTKKAPKNDRLEQSSVLGDKGRISYFFLATVSSFIALSYIFIDTKVWHVLFTN